MIVNRAQKPVTDSELNFKLPITESFTLKNGLKVYFCHKNNLPMIRLNLMINAGSKFDTKDKNGLAYLTTLTLDEGADGMDALELSDEFDLLGSNFNLSTDNDCVYVSLQSLTDKFERSLGLFSKVILKPNFANDDFEREKSKLITRIIQSKDEPEYLADQVFDHTIFGDSHFYSSPVSGYEETVQSISLIDIKEHYKKYFTPKNSSLVVVGNLSKQELEKLLIEYLGNWSGDENQFLPEFQTVEQSKKIFILHKPDSVQTEIRVGHISHKRSSEDYFQRMILNTILGGQFTSRINLNLRERNGYTYGATSKYQYYKDAAFFEVSTSVGIENTGNALKEILFELENIKNGILDKELEFAKSSITKKFPLNFETYRQIAAGISGKVMFNLPDDYLDNYISNVNSVSKTEVENAANDFIDYNNLTIVLVGDKNIIKEKIKDIEIDFSEVDLKGNLL
jgi:zinc protease